MDPAVMVLSAVAPEMVTALATVTSDPVSVIVLLARVVPENLGRTLFVPESVIPDIGMPVKLAGTTSTTTSPVVGTVVTLELPADTL
jgi:hypothetical protein